MRGWQYGIDISVDLFNGTVQLSVPDVLWSTRTPLTGCNRIATNHFLLSFILQHGYGRKIVIQFLLINRKV